MFALLGEIVFETIAAPEAFSSSTRWRYAEHRVIEGAPRLQWIGDSLQTITIDMMFHAAFTDPAAQIDALTAAASDHNARPLVFGNGDYRGYFIVSSISAVTMQTSDAGDTIAIKARAKLTQWVLGGAIDPNAPPQPSFTPVAAVMGAGGAPTGPVAYSAPTGIGPTIATPAADYVAPALAAPGVSSILNNPAAGGAFAAKTLPGDIAPAAIVRAPA